MTRTAPTAQDASIRTPLHGAWLETAANAPLNTETFPYGYTFEAFPSPDHS